jgi:hypothetical protein
MPTALVAALLAGLVFQAAPLKVNRDKNEKENKHWTILTVPAAAPYQNVLPELRLECTQQEETKQFMVEETNEFSVVLDAGALRSGSGNVVSLAVKLDRKQPASHQWMELPDHKSYRYYAYPGSEPNRDPNLPDDARKVLEETRIQSDTSKFLENLFSAKVAVIELQPAGGAAVQVRFEIDGLRKEFDKYPECRAYYRTPR